MPTSPTFSSTRCPTCSVDVGRAPFSMGGGSFGGGGAGGSWGGAVPVRGIAADAARADVTAVSRVASSSADAALKTSAKASSKLADLFDVDDGWLILVPIAIALAALAAAVWAIWIAPALLAEALLDVLVVSALYRKLRGVEPRSWLTGAVRRTWPAAAALAAIVVLGGFVLQRAVPEADSIGDVFVQGQRD